MYKFLQSKVLLLFNTDCRVLGKGRKLILGRVGHKVNAILDFFDTVSEKIEYRFSVVLTILDMVVGTTLPVFRYSILRYSDRENAPQHTRSKPPTSSQEDEGD